jgi:hypothetical protein
LAKIPIAAWPSFWSRVRRPFGKRPHAVAARRRSARQGRWVARGSAPPPTQPTGLLRHPVALAGAQRSRGGRGCHARSALDPGPPSCPGLTALAGSAPLGSTGRRDDEEGTPDHRPDSSFPTVPIPESGPPEASLFRPQGGRRAVRTGGSDGPADPVFVVRWLSSGRRKPRASARRPGGRGRRTSALGRRVCDLGMQGFCQGSGRVCQGSRRGSAGFLSRSASIMRALTTPGTPRIGSVRSGHDDEF